MTKTDNILKLIMILRIHRSLHKTEVMSLLKRSRPQVYKLIAEFKQGNANRPAVLVECNEGFITLTEAYQ